MGQRSFIINVIIGSILIGIAVAANYCQLCRNHVACRPKRGFGRACGNSRSTVPLNQNQQQQIIQVHDGLRSVIAFGLLKGYKSAQRMGHMRWNNELAKLAAINARQCRVHYDACRKTEQFPSAGQNVGIDRTTDNYHATNQSIHSITLGWFRQFTLTNATAMESYFTPKNKKRRFNNFATMVHDRQTHIGCAAVRYKKGRYYYFYLVCNYAVRALAGGKVYTAGVPYAGCTAGRSKIYPGLCQIDEPIKAIAYPTPSSGVTSLRKTGRKRTPRKAARNKTQTSARGRVRGRAQARAQRRTQGRAQGRLAMRVQQRKQPRTRPNRIRMVNRGQANPFGNVRSFFGG